MKTTVRKPPTDLRSIWQLIKRMFRFMAPVKFHAFVTCIVIVACNGAEVLTDWMLRPAVNVVKDLAEDHSRSAPQGVWEWLTASAGTGASLRHALLALALAKLLFSLLVWAKTVAANWQSMSMVFHMRAAIYDRLQRVGFSFYDQYSTGQLINRALGDLQNVRHFVAFGLHSSIDIVFTLLGYFALLMYRSPLLAGIVALSLPIWFWTIRRFTVLSRPIYEKQMLAADDTVRLLTENIAGVHVVRAFATEKEEKSKFKAGTDELLQRMLEGAGLQQRMAPTVRGIAALTYILLFSVGAVMVQQGGLEVGDLVFFGVAMGKILGRVQQINAICDAYQRAAVSSSRVFEILDNPDTTPERPNAEPLRPGGGAVRFSHVSFSYEPGKPVLNDVSFSVPAGSVVAVVGPTGSGKTTLSGLLARFYDTEMGGVEIDGQDVRDMTLQSVRDAIGYVFQETFLFSDTVARNIAYGDLSAPAHSIKEAARIAHADEFIDQLPEKYESVIGEYGATLSGGQRQRLAIARAILHNPRILVLDDSLSAVDSETESLIRAGLEEVMKGRTVFLITSRISTARRADRIFILEDGQITQSGTHDELLAEPGYYSEVASAQFSDEGPGQEASHMDRMTRRSRSGRMVEI